ncbi:hypothetical protein ACP70R_041227 [Stipagrostis hirtigluma subsp. patula]
MSPATPWKQTMGPLLLLLLVVVVLAMGVTEARDPLGALLLGNKVVPQVTGASGDAPVNPAALTGATVPGAAAGNIVGPITTSAIAGGNVISPRLLNLPLQLGLRDFG